MGALHSRKIDSVQRIWCGLYDLSKMKGAASWIGLIKWDALAEEAEKEPMVLKLFDGLEGVSREEVIHKLDAFYQTIHAERLYVSQNAWTLCRAYVSILRHYMMFLCMLRERIPAATLASLFFNDGELRKLLSAAVPAKSEFIEHCDREHLYMLLESIEVYLLNDLRHTLDGKQADDWHADKALDLAAQLQKVEDEEMRRKVADIYPALRSRQPR
jgi:hypothetical protein